MTTIFIFGEKKDRDFEKLVLAFLSKTYNITYFGNGRFYSCGKGYELVFIDSEKLCDISSDKVILLLKENAEMPKIKLPKNSIVIANSENIAQLSSLNSKNNVIICGKSEMDTFSFSSYTDDGAVITLNREIVAFSGKKIQPLETPIDVPKGLNNIYSLIAFTALRFILDDFESDIGKLY